MTPLFRGGGLAARVLRADEVPQLQRLFEADPSYFLAVNGRPPRPDEAQVEFEERPPPHLGWRANHVLGLFDEADGALQGTLIVVQDLAADAVWHVALLWLTAPVQGRGRGGALYRAAEAWMRAQGARWVRLGVVAGNARAEGFWQRMGFERVRWRRGVDTGGRINDVSVMLRPLGDETLEAYLARVPRDRPDADLP